MYTSAVDRGPKAGSRSRFVPAGLLAVFAAFALVFVGLAGSAEASPVVWSAQHTPSVKGGGFRAVSCVGTKRCVGVGGASTTSSQRSLAETESSGGWKVDTLPQPAGDSQLYGVSCRSLTSCVAVGSTLVGGHYRVVTEVLSGTTWKLVAPAALAGVTDAQLSAVSCPEANVCVAVGYWDDSTGHSGTLAESYNGHAWTLIKTRAFTGDAEFNGISCLTDTTPLLCTAVGDVSSGTKTKPLVEHVNGSTWSVVSVPNLAGSGGVALQAVSCPQPTSCVAVGSALQGNFFRAVSEIDNLNHWTVVAAKSPPVPHGSVSLTGVSCPLSIQSCRAVGEYGVQTQSTLAETWNGQHWTIQSSADPTDLSQLDAVSCVTIATTGVACTAAGEYQGTPQAPSHTLAEHN
jgi:hypothetical protein